MTIDEHKEIAQNWISLWNPPVNWDLFNKLHANNFEDCSSSGRPTNREGFALGIEKLLNAFPDLKTVIKDLVYDSQNSKVAIRWEAFGTNKKKYLGVGPTEKKTKITGIEIIEIKNNQIIKRWGEWDITSHSK